MRIATIASLVLVASLAASCRCGKGSGADEALERAIRSGDLEGARKALAQGADARSTGRVELDPAKLREGRSVEQWLGIYLKRTQLLNALLLPLDEQMCPAPKRAGAKPSAPPAASAEEVDVKAASREALAAAGGLAKTLAEVGAQELKGVSRLHLAAVLCQPALVEALAAGGADVRARDGVGFTPLHWASCAPVAQALLAAGADPRAASSAGLTPLHLAIDRDVVRVLLKAGADLEARDTCGNRPLHTASWLGLGGGPPPSRSGEAESGEEPPPSLRESMPRLVLALGDWVEKTLEQVDVDQLEKLLDRFDVAAELVRAGALASVKNDAGFDAHTLAVSAHAHHHD